MTNIVIGKKLNGNYKKCRGKEKQPMKNRNPFKFSAKKMVNNLRNNSTIIQSPFKCSFVFFSDYPHNLWEIEQNVKNTNPK